MADETLRRTADAADEQGPAPEAGEQPTPRRTPRRKKADAPEINGQTAEAAPDEAPKKPRARRKKADAPEAPPEAPPARPPAEAPPSSGADEPERPRRRRTPRKAEPVASSDAPVEVPERERDEAPESRPESRPDDRPGDRRDRDDRGAEPQNREYRDRPDAGDEGGEGRGRRRRKRDRRKKNRDGGGNQGHQGQGPNQGQGQHQGQGQQQGQHQSQNQGGNGQQPAGEPFEGMLELIGDKKFGFIRGMSTSLQKGDNDPFMPPPLIQKFNLRDGVALKGTITRGRKGAWQVARVDEVMGMPPEEWKELAEFDAGMVIYPEEKLNLIAGPSDVSMRVIDLVAPIGKGQRSLIVAPPRAGKTVILKKIAEGLEQNHPEVELIALLIDERPEEVTDFRRNTKARVFASSNDAGEDNHVRVATLAFEYARRFVEMGRDVVILLDSLTRLGRTFNLWGGNSGRTMSGGLDARALLIPRKIFGAARNIENGGSLTIIATALVETGSRMDDVIFEEFKGTGNAEIVLDRELADKRIYPAINIRKSGTRNEERLMPEEQIRQRHMLFRVLNARHPVEAMQALVRQIQLSPTNVHLLNELIPEQY